MPDGWRAGRGGCGCLLAGNQNFINQSTTLTIGPAEGAGLFVIGAQEGVACQKLGTT